VHFCRIVRAQLAFAPADFFEDELSADNFLRDALGALAERVADAAGARGPYTILRLPILYGKYCNSGWSGGTTILRNSVGNEGMEWGAQTRGVLADKSIDSCTKASNKTNIL